MNVFAVSECPVESAKALCSQHQKMILESAQLLSAAHHFWDKEKAIPGIYKLSHLNHPSTVWARSTGANYRWLVKHFESLLDEFESRSGHRHKSGELLILLRKKPKNLEMGKLEVLLVAMKDEFRLNEGKTWEEVVSSYRNYYVTAKEFATWLNTKPPQWFIDARAKRGSTMYTKAHVKGIEYRFTLPSSKKPGFICLSPLREFLRSLKI